MLRCIISGVCDLLLMRLKHGPLLIKQHLVKLRSDAVRAACYSKIIRYRVYTVSGRCFNEAQLSSLDCVIMSILEDYNSAKSKDVW